MAIKDKRAFQVVNKHFNMPVCDDVIEGNHLKLKHPFTALVSGPTSCGKSYFVRQLLAHFNNCTTISAKRLPVLYFHGQHQDLFQQDIAANVDVCYVHIPSCKHFEERAEALVKKLRPLLVVVDDLLNELGGSSTLVNLFTKGSHHQLFSIVFLVQNIFHKGKELRTLSLNCHYLIVFKNNRDKSQITHLARQVLPENIAGFREMYEDATRDPYTYLLVDCAADSPDEVRFRTKILPIEEIKGSSYGSIVVYKSCKSFDRGIKR